MAFSQALFGLSFLEENHPLGFIESASSEILRQRMAQDPRVRRDLTFEPYEGFAPPRAAVAKVPPSPIVSTADEGTITIDPRSLMASYSMFIARRWSATGLSW